MSYKEKIQLEKLPVHVAVIMDGNGRWAQKKNKPRIFGHQEGTRVVRQTIEMAAKLKIQHLTLYTFSKENWNRPCEEVSALMALLIKTINREEKKLIETNVKLNIIGDMDDLPVKVVKKLKKVLKETAHCTGLNLHLAFNYSSYWEIVQAIKKIVLEVQQNTLNINDITSALFEKYLSTKGIPNPELLIRTSGEFRLSNFLLWQLAYTELYFTNVLWPDFNEREFYKAIYNFQQRERRFGLTSLQVNQKDKK